MTQDRRPLDLSGSTAESTPLPGLADPDDLVSSHDAGDGDAKLTKSGALAWMAGNPVAANLLVILLLFGGLLMMTRIRQEVFPEFELDLVLVSVAYPGASPEEVEQGVLLAIEEQVRAVDGIEEVTATANEGVGTVAVELMQGVDADRALSDIKSAVDRITSFPKDIERPIVSVAQNRREVISLVLYGDVTEAQLRELAEQARDDLLQDPGITVVELGAVRPLEVSIEVPRAELRRHGLTLEQIAARVRESSVELPGGGLKTAGGEVLLRTAERKDRGAEFADVLVASNPDGSEVRVGDLARVVDGFQENDQEAYFNGARAVLVRVFRVGEQTPLSIAASVKELAERYQRVLPPGVSVATWNDTSETYASRLELLTENGIFGLVLVLITLGLFLEIRLAFWVTTGIPTSLLGSMLFLPWADVSINMVSMFAFIVTLGIVVDDAIVVGEAVYKRRTDGHSPLRAAVEGVREVAVPVVFSVLTTIVAFAPLLFLPGIMGKFFRVIPVTVIIVLGISLVESLFALPAHLAELSDGSRGFLGAVHRQQQRVSRSIEWLIRYTYLPVVRAAVHARYLTLAVGAAIVLLTGGLVAGGFVAFTFFPKIESDLARVNLRMPYGTSVEETKREALRIERLGRELLEELGGADRVGRGIFTMVGGTTGVGGGAMRGSSGSGAASHRAEVALYLVPMDQRSFTASEFVRRWRERVGEIAGAENLRFDFTTGPGGSAAIDVQLSHRDVPTLEAAAARVADELRGFAPAGVFDVDPGFSPGKEQLDFRVRPAAQSLGITPTILAQQVRSSFYGAEAVRQQRGRDEVRVFVRLPRDERSSEHDVETMLLRTPRGGEVPLWQAADVVHGRSYTEIVRKDGRRVLDVTADVDPAMGNANDIVAKLEADALPTVLADTPGLSYRFAGQQEDQAESLSALCYGMALALGLNFALLAIVFRSYFQPLIIMTVIPFGIAGAVLGHFVLGYDLSFISGMGLVALTGVVVNDSLVLIDATNKYRHADVPAMEAIVAAGARRFRPIMLTSLTTFFGLVPMILETSLQARFLIPMAISLGVGVMFATFVTLLIVPALYLVLEDAFAAFRWVWGGAGEGSAALAGEPAE